MTKIKLCTCTHPSQDKLYGPNQRVHNVFYKGTLTMHRCTVCLKEKQ